MSKKDLRTFLSILPFSVIFVLGAVEVSKELTKVLVARELRTNPGILASFAAQRDLEQQLQKQYPLIKKGTVMPSISAKTALSTLVKPDGTLRTLYKKEERTPVLIASLTKLMTALAALKHYAPTQEIVITQDILKEQGEAGYLREGEVFSVKDLLYLVLMESSNDAAAALGEPLGREVFIERMRQEAENLGMRETIFENPTGLDPAELEQGNYSSAEDLTKLGFHLLTHYPQVFDILEQQELDLYTREGIFHHTMRNTNPLLHYSEWPAKILGGKTGSTLQAKESLLLLLESPDHEGYILNVILGSDDRLTETRTLLRWILESYQWQT